MPRIRTASRLHFGLLNPAGHVPGLLARAFGGVGLMVERPGITLRLEPAGEWSADGPLAQRALTFALRFARSSADRGPGPRPPLRVVVESAAPEHVGLGTGTQLGLAVALAAAEVWGLTCGVEELARRVGRGQRSGLGAHGFAQGGFLVEGGRQGDRLAPLLARLPFPDGWRVLLVLASDQPGCHGTLERSLFTEVSGEASLPLTDSLCRLVLLGLLPSLVEGDLEAFGEALYEYNVRAGEVFSKAQGGTYARPEVAALVAFLRAQGVRGAGQSSWGPAVFGVVEEDRAAHLAEAVRSAFSLPEAQVWVTAACNDGATTE